MLSDQEILQAWHRGCIGIYPYDDEALQPASYDVHLGEQFKEYSAHHVGQLMMTVVDPLLDSSHLFVNYGVVDGCYVLPSNGFVLATTIERIELDAQHAARIEGKSSLARLGLAVHITAGFVDPGFRGQLTLEIVNLAPLPIRLTPGMAIAQLAFEKLATPAVVPYDGKYQDQVGATASRYHENTELT